MSKTFKEQDTYDYIHENNDDKIPTNRFYKLIRYFRRLNGWDWDFKIMYRRYKDYKRGGKARIKGKNYKNR